MKVLRDPRLVECCGQHYCDLCLNKWIISKNNEKTCPNCREKVFQSVLNKEKIREINALHVRCSNTRKGCEWEGELQALKEHLELDNGCEYETVCCGKSAQGGSPHVIPSPFPVFGECSVSLVPTSHNRQGSLVYSCSAKMERRHLTEHQEKECKYRQYTCDHCGYEDTYEAIAGRRPIYFSRNDSLSNHYDKCHCYPLNCPNKCGEKNIKRKNMRSHRSSCILEPLKCPFHYVGCTERIKRKDMDAHRQQNMEKHLVMLAKSHERLVQKVEPRQEEEEEVEYDEEEEQGSILSDES